MRGLLHGLNIVSWPIWAKLLGGFLVAIVVPAALITFVALVGIREISVQNARLLVAEEGRHSLQLIENTLSRARTTLGAFVENDGYQRALLDLLLDDAQSSDALESALLLPNASLYDSVRLLDRNGMLVTQISTGGSLLNVSGEDQSQSPSYLAAVNAQIQGEGDRTLTVSTTALGLPAIEITQAIRWRDGNVIGYLIAPLNTQRVLYSNLTSHDEDFPTYSFMVTDNGILLSPRETQPLVTLNSVAVERALAGESGVDAYQVGGEDGPQVVGYYAPIPETPFVMVTEIQTASLTNSVFGYFGGARAFTIVVGTALLMGVLVILFNQLLSPPLNRLRRAIVAMTGGNYDEPVPAARRGDEIGSLATAFVDMREQVRGLVSELESRVALRTRDMNATQEISRTAATQRDLQILMDQVVDLIVARFPAIYHAQIFLLDSAREWAALEASTGEAGQILLARGHRLAVGSVSVIGQVTQQGRVVVARDTATSRVHRRNEFLPDTRAELAIPLKVGDLVIGALDVQSKENGVFTDDEISVLQTMADQIAVAIENARLYQLSLRRLEEIERNNRLATLTAWERYLHEQRVQQLTSAAGTQTGLDMSDLRRQALAQNQIVVGELTERQTVPIAVPIQLRGQALGAVEWELPAQDFDDNKLQLAQELANRLAISLDNARLFQEAQRTTERERLVSSIAAKLTAQTDIDEILQTAVREVGQALRSPQVSIRLNRANGGNGKD